MRVVVELTEAKVQDIKELTQETFGIYCCTSNEVWVNYNGEQIYLGVVADETYERLPEIKAFFDTQVKLAELEVMIRTMMTSRRVG